MTLEQCRRYDPLATTLDHTVHPNEQSDGSQTTPVHLSLGRNRYQGMWKSGDHETSLYLTGPDGVMGTYVDTLQGRQCHFEVTSSGISTERWSPVPRTTLYRCAREDAIQRKAEKLRKETESGADASDACSWSILSGLFPLMGLGQPELHGLYG